MMIKVTFAVIESSLWLLAKAMLILVIGYFAINWLAKIVSKSLQKTKMDISLSKFIVKSIKIVLYVIVVLSALNALGISTTGLLAALSAAAVGIALALKDSLSNIAGGILLLVSPRFSTGDFIEINGQSGNVLQIDLMHTTLRTLDNRHVVIPNGNIMGNQLVNFSQEEKRRVDIVFSISYQDDIALAKKVIGDVINNHKLVITEPDKPFVRVNEYASSSVNIVTRSWCLAKDYWTVYFDLLEEVKVALDKNGISIPFDQLDVHITQGN